jgi:hypothetical protein
MKNSMKLAEEVAFKSGFFAAQSKPDQKPDWGVNDAWEEFQVAQARADAGEIISEKMPKN